MKYFCIQLEHDGSLLTGAEGSPSLFRTKDLAEKDLWLFRAKVVPVELKICTPSRRANSAAKKKELKMASAKKVVKKPAGEVPWPAKKAKLKPKAKGKK